MLQQKILSDPRQYCRFKALDSAYVLLKTQLGERLGFLSDFSSGGLSFEYIPTEETLEKNCQIDIILDDKNIHIEIPSCSKISEFELEDKYYSPVKMHRVGVQFNEIEPRKLNDLVSLICPKRNLI
ncbi:MAG: PilZ domain-containing protein [Desulfobacterales bacterium]|nr:PilZ domain-containing protein [Desulfobacterales bacterium]